MRRATLWNHLTPLALASSLLLGPTLVQAQPGVDEPPVPGQPRPLVLPAFEETTLANGVRVIVAPRHELPLVSVVLHLRPGNAADPAGREGLTSLTAQLRAKGASRGGRAVGATELARQAEALGGTLNVGSSWGGQSVDMTVATSKLDAATALVVDVARRPLLAADELERLRTQVADSLKFPLSDPMALAGMVAKRSAWGSSAYGGTTTPASLARITLADVQGLQQRLARPDQATLVMAGDVTLAQARALAERLLGDWQTPHDAALAARAEPPSPQLPATVLVNLPGAGQSGVVVSAESVPVDAPDRRVAQVATAVLGGGYSARLSTEIRIRRGLSYGAYASADQQRPGGFVFASAQTKNPSAAEVVKLMREAMLQLGREAPPADELAARQASLVGGFSRHIETTAGLAATVLGEVERNRPLSGLREVAPAIQAVTAEQVRDFAQRHWRDASVRAVVVGDLTAAGESLQALDPQALRLEAPALDLSSPTLGK